MSEKKRKIVSSSSTEAIKSSLPEDSSLPLLNDNSSSPSSLNSSSSTSLRSNSDSNPIARRRSRRSSTSQFSSLLSKKLNPKKRTKLSNSNEIDEQNDISDVSDHSDTSEATTVIVDADGNNDVGLTTNDEDSSSNQDAESDDDSLYALSMPLARLIKVPNASSGRLPRRTKAEAQRASASSQHGQSDAVRIGGMSSQVAIGFADCRGLRPAMEDAVLLRARFVTEPDCDLVAVFDGHGGAQAANAAADYLPTLLRRALSKHTNGDAGSDVEENIDFRQALIDSLAETQLRLDQGAIDGGCTAIVSLITPTTLYVANIGDCRAVLGSADARDVAVRQTHEPSIRPPVSNNNDNDDNNNSNNDSIDNNNDDNDDNDDDDNDHSQSNSQRLVNSAPGRLNGPSVLAKSASHVHSISGASSQPNISTRWSSLSASGEIAPQDDGAPRAIRLTIDHKPTLDRERRRIMAAGGFVARGRVDGLLAVSRALGDRPLAPHVCHLPDIFELKDWKRHCVLIIACDGLWDVLSDQEAISIALSTRNVEKAAQRLRARALFEGSSDNISVVVIRLDDGAFVRRTTQRRHRSIQSRSRINETPHSQPTPSI